MTDNKENIKTFLDNRLKECNKNIVKLRKKYMFVKIFYATTIIITITSGTVIASLSPTILPPLVITVLSITGTLSAALSVKFNLKKKKNRLQETINESNVIKNKLEYIITCNGDVDIENILQSFGCGR